MPSIRLSLAIFVVGNAVLAWFAHREYTNLVEFCEDSFEVQQGGDRFSCLEPYNWPWIYMEGFFVLLLEIALLVVVGAAIVHRRGKRRPIPEVQ
jgi:hypothetical protein